MLSPQAISVATSEPPVFDTTTPASKVRRFSLADLAELGNWLVGRCKERWPRAGDRMIWGWLNSSMNDQAVCMMRCDKAVGMVRVIREPLESAVIIEELFCFAMDGGLDDAVELYPAFRTWAENIRASEWRFGQFSDVPASILKERVGGRKSRTVHYVDTSPKS